MLDDIPRGRLAKKLIALRSSRCASLPGIVFSDDVWGILLELFLAHADGHAISSEEVLQRAGALPGAGERWIMYLKGQGLVTASSEGETQLSAQGLQALRSYFDKAGPLLTAAD